MKLDANALRYLLRDDWRVLTAVELGQKNVRTVAAADLIHESVLIPDRHGGVFQSLSTCLKHKLLHHDNSKYDGYRLTSLGYDFLAVHTLTMRGVITSVGRQIGVGKESDLYEVADEDGTVMAMKLHRLGRTSFRDVKTKRDYLRKGNHYSWLYLSRLAATKEFAFMKALGARGLPVPEAIDHNRHVVLMQMVEGDQLAQVRELEDPGPVFEEMVQIMCDMVRVGLVHCDFNEFNVIISPSNTLVAIDFPQMVSVSHANARALFERDLNCILRFFEKKMGYHVSQDVLPVWDELLREVVKADAVDVELHASGFNHKDGDVVGNSHVLQHPEPIPLHESTEESPADSSDDAESSIDISRSHEASYSNFRNCQSGTAIQNLRIHDSEPLVSNAADQDGHEAPNFTEPSKHGPQQSERAQKDVLQCSDAVHSPESNSDDCDEINPGDDVRQDQAGRRQHVATSQHEALAQLHRKAKAQARRQSQTKASRNSVKPKGRRKHAAQSLF